MALNYSHISKDNLVSPVRIVNGYLVEGVSENENNGEVYSRTWHVNQLEADELNFSCGRDRVDCCSSSESTSEDIVDLLPSDPFGMDMETFTALSGLLQDCGGYMRSNNCQEGYGLFAEWNFIWNNAFKFQQIPYTIQLNERLNTFSNNLQVNEKPGTCSDYFPRGFQFDQKIHTTHTWSIYEDERALGTIMWEMLASGDVGFFNGSASCSFDMRSTGEADGASEIEGAPHEAFNYVLSYLDVKDLLSVERVCSSLSTAVRGDPLFWKTIHIDQPLNERINDDVLVQLASRAQGKLECLNLVECPKVTDDGLRRVLEANRRLTKVSGPIISNYPLALIIHLF